MKNLISVFFVFSFFISSITLSNAQGKPAKLPMENKTTFETFLKDVYTLYEKHDYKALKNIYDRQAGEIGPDGMLIMGIKNLEASWKMFDGMVDGTPTFTYQLTSSRMVTPEIAIITWDSDADIKIKGQQIGGKATGMAVLKKKGNGWQIQFDTMTPVMAMPMPAPEAAPAMDGNKQ
ncbi:MAG: nuclear transport factor 2 family protein [Saprospiraceae bacterium]|nr:nuclear transport factor 2 family protein [Saprospiraceae bacterium]HRG69815.1 nuclear transport factor 2 family protein [Saprospiraceae bacterium]